MFVIKYAILGLGAIFLGAFLVNFLTNYLSPRGELQKVDAIIAISGGDTTARTEQAIKLYEAGWATQLVFSGAALDPLSPSNAQVMREIAKRAAVPDAVIQIEEKAQNTAQNAIKSEAIAQKKDYESIILVTSPYHQRRAYIEFRDKLGPDVVIINYPVVNDDWATTWWYQPSGWQITMSETLKVGVTILRNLF